MTTPFDDILCKPYQQEIDAFGKHWCGPERYEHWEKPLVAEYLAFQEGDGQAVKVFCTAAPARFYELTVKAKGDKKAYTVSTGSGMAHLAAMIAEAIAGGMLGFERSQTP